MKSLLILSLAIYSTTSFSNTIDVSCSNATGTIRYTGDSHGYRYSFVTANQETVEFTRGEVKYTSGKKNSVSERNEDFQCHDDIFATYSKVTEFVEEGMLNKKDGSHFAELEGQSQLHFFLFCEKVERLSGSCE